MRRSHTSPSSLSLSSTMRIIIFIVASTVLIFLYSFNSSSSSMLGFKTSPKNIHESNSKKGNNTNRHNDSSGQEEGMSSMGITASKTKNNSSPSKSKSNYQPFNSTNPNSDFCPYAKCHNSPLCTPCNRRYIFILATGRSGSTTLLKMINTLPLIRLSGENRNFIGIASQLISNFQASNSQQKGTQFSPLLDQHEDRPDGAFMHNAIPPQAMSCPIQQALNTLNPPPQSIQQNDHILSINEYDAQTIMGCKTIRFHKNNFSIQYAADYIRNTFPCSKIIVNVRTNITSQIQSIQGTFTSATQGDHGKSIHDIDMYNTYLSNLATELGTDMAKVIDLSQWRNDVNVFNDVAQWLGFRNCAFTSIVHENVNGFGRDHETDVGIDDACHYPAHS